MKKLIFSLCLILNLSRTADAQWTKISTAMPWRIKSLDTSSIQFDGGGIHFADIHGIQHFGGNLGVTDAMFDGNGALFAVGTDGSFTHWFFKIDTSSNSVIHIDSIFDNEPYAMVKISDSLYAIGGSFSEKLLFYNPITNIAISAASLGITLFDCNVVGNLVVHNNKLYVGYGVMAPGSSGFVIINLSTFQIIPNNNPFHVGCSTISIIDDSTIYTSHEYFLSSYVIKSIDDGITWDTILCVSGQGPGDVFSISESNGYLAVAGTFNYVLIWSTQVLDTITNFAVLCPDTTLTNYGIPLTATNGLDCRSVLYHPLGLFVSGADGVYAKDFTFVIDTSNSGMSSNILSPSPLTLYPNPVTSTLTVSGLSANATIQITDISGRVLFTSNINHQPSNLPTSNINPQPSNINMSAYPSGVYILRSGNEVRKVIKF